MSRRGSMEGEHVPSDSNTWKDRLKVGDRVETRDGVRARVTQVHWGRESMARQVLSVELEGHPGRFTRRALKRKLG